MAENRGDIPTSRGECSGRKSSMSKGPVAGGCMACLRNKEDNVAGGMGNEGERLRPGMGRLEARQDGVWCIRRSVLPPSDKQRKADGPS